MDLFGFRFGVAEILYSIASSCEPLVLSLLALLLLFVTVALLFVINLVVVNTRSVDPEWRNLRLFMTRPKPLSLRSYLVVPLESLSALGVF